jgi:AcrR family transcriptional regulator
MSATKTRILDAADEIFVRRGIDGARMQEIADQAGVNKALLHYHFRSKAELARAVWLRIASSFVPGIFQMMASDISLDEKIDRFVDTYHAACRRAAVPRSDRQRRELTSTSRAAARTTSSGSRRALTIERSEADARDARLRETYGLPRGANRMTDPNSSMADRVEADVQAAVDALIDTSKMTRILAQLTREQRRELLMQAADLRLRYWNPKRFAGQLRRVAKDLRVLQPKVVATGQGDV